MTTVQIHIPDDRAAALSTAAAAQGMSLESWIQRMAEEATTGGGNHSLSELTQSRVTESPRGANPKRISQTIAEIISGVPEEELAKLPTDGASEHDHYIYGWPKRHQQ